MSEIGIGPAGTTPVSDGVAVKWQTPAGGSSKIFLFASLAGTASATPGLLQQFNVSTANPGGVIEQANPAAIGINNGDINPFYLPACTLTKAGMTKAGAAVSTATAGGSMTARITLRNAAYSTAADLGNLDFPIAAAGVFNDSSADTFERGIVLAPSIAIAEGTLFGAYFQDRAGTDDLIVALRGIYLYFEFTLP